MKIIKNDDNITVVFDNGNIISSSECTEEMFAKIYNNHTDEEYVKNILIPQFSVKKQEIEDKVALVSSASSSKYLTAKGTSVYLLSISELSIPEDLVSAILKAERENDEELIQTYMNFWTLVSLNPDSRCRQNMFWFLDKYGMTISKSGLFVAYRNVGIKKAGDVIDGNLAKFITSEYARIKFISKKSPKNYSVCRHDGSFVTKKNNSDDDVDGYFGNLAELYTALSDADVATTYTDHHSRTFEIKIGEVVSMPREECDSIQENSCSRGLHVAGKDWLKNNYFGEVGLMVLVNPADVVAVPPIDGYGKMRTCAYYPVSIVEFNESGDIIDTGVEDGFEDDFMDIICYGGQSYSNDSNPYSLTIPDIPEIDKSQINDRLLEIAKSINKLTN